MLNVTKFNNVILTHNIQGGVMVAIRNKFKIALLDYCYQTMYKCNSAVLLYLGNRPSLTKMALKRNDLATFNLKSLPVLSSLFEQATSLTL